MSNQELLKKFAVAASTNSGWVHVIPSKNVWLVKKEGLRRSSAIRPTKEAAIEVARKLKPSIKIIIHSKDGTITVNSNEGVAQS
jgi:hypothetical protein